MYRAGRDFSRHCANCKARPNYWNERRKNQTANTEPRINFEQNCPKCYSIFYQQLTKYQIQNKLYRKFCFRKCANSREQTKEIRQKKSKTITNNLNIMYKLRQKRLHQIFPKKDTKIEIILQKELTKRDIPFVTHKALFGQPDIFIEPNICVFADGDYWHNYPEGRD